MCGNYFLLSLVLFASVLPAIKCGGLDLNKPPDYDFEGTSEPGETQAQRRRPAASRAASRPITRETMVKLLKLQTQINEFFNSLSICDDQNFDIAKIKMPDSWSKEAKAMMALTRVAKKKLIKLRDMDRYRRIMANCNQISRIFEERAEREADLRSKWSGMKDIDSEELIRQMEVSPLEDMKNRFNRLNLFDRTNSARVGERQKPEPRWFPHRSSIDTRGLIPIKLTPVKTERRDNVPQLINFFK